MNRGRGHYCSIATASVMLLFCTLQTHALDGNFVTIIGPDGRPMVIPVSPSSKRASSQVDTPVRSQSDTGIAAKFSSNPDQMNRNMQGKTNSNSAIISHPEQPSIRPQSNSLKNVSTTIPAVSVYSEVQLSSRSAQKPESSTKDLNSTTTSKSTGVTSDTDAVTVIDGEKYYTAEYLERTEFNPERKKRFYHIPTGNLNGSWQMVEREKGIDQSWFKRTVKPSTLQPVALGSHYAILDQSDLLKALPSRCFSLPKQSKKMLSREKNVSLFIKPTFQEGFDYQLVQLKGTPTYVSLMAFADRQQSPRYYWPLVVFLDHAGCVVEGASAFLSQTHAATMLQQAALEGVLRVPEQSQFMLLTPLQQAVDVPDAQLTNQGQIRLAVLR